MKEPLWLKWAMLAFATVAGLASFVLYGLKVAPGVTGIMIAAAVVLFAASIVMIVRGISSNRLPPPPPGGGLGLRGY